MRVLLVFLLLVGAGCTQTAAPDDDPGSEPTGPSPEWVTWYFDEGGALVDALPMASSQPLAWSLGDWLLGIPAPAWTRAEDTGLHVLAGDLTLWFEADAPVSGADARPEFTAWWGTTQNVQHHVFIDGPDVLLPGEPTEATSALRLPEGGYVVPPWATHQTRVGTYYADGSNVGTVSLLTGAGHPSRLDLLVVPLEFEPTDVESVLDETVTLAGGRCAVDANPGGAAETWFDFEVTDEMVGIEAWLAAGDGGPTQDIDFRVLGPDGQDVGGGHGSYELESMIAWTPNLEAAGTGTYQIHVYNCTPQVREIGIGVQAHVPSASL